MFVVAMTQSRNLIRDFLAIYVGEKIMETMKMTDRQANEICDAVGRILVDELNTRNIQTKVEKTVSDYLKSHSISEDASKLAKNLEWSVKVRMKK